MPLNKNTLETKIKEAFRKAKNTPPPADPSASDATQEQILAQLSVDLADAIDTFLRSGNVAGVTVDVVDNAHHPIGTGTQTGVGRVE